MEVIFPQVFSSSIAKFMVEYPLALPISRRD